MTNNSTDLLSLFSSLGSLEDGLNEYRLPLTSKLAGQQFELYLEEDDKKIFIHFKNGNQLEWSSDGEPLTVEHYEAIEIRPNIFFVDWVYHADPKQSLSIVIDLVAQESTLLWSQLPNAEDARPDLFERIKKLNDLSAVKVHITHAGINRKRTEKVHCRTTELVGKRLKQAYSSQHAFEHIYLSERLFTWHSLMGPDKGLADTDPVDYVKIADNLYLYCWRERLIPWVGIEMMDLLKMRSAGKVFYSDLVDPDKVTNYTIGAHLEFLS